MIQEHDRVILSRDLPSEKLKKDDLGVVIHVHAENQAYEVEFLTVDGMTITVCTLARADIRPLRPGLIPHVRELAV